MVGKRHIPAPVDRVSVGLWGVPVRCRAHHSTMGFGEFRLGQVPKVPHEELQASTRRQAIRGVQSVHFRGEPGLSSGEGISRHRHLSAVISPAGAGGGTQRLPWKP